MAEWYSIDSAEHLLPVQGSEVLLWIPGDLDTGRRYMIISGYRSARAWRDTTDCFVRLSPTHWMPLPNPPIEEMNDDS